MTPLHRTARVLLWTLLALVAAVTLVRVLGVERGYPLVPVMAAFPYVVALGWVVTLLAAALRWRRGLLVGVLLALVGAILLGPRVVPDRQPFADGARVVVAVANLLEGAGDAATLVEIVRREDVDVLVTLELTPGAIERLEAAGLVGMLPHSELLPSRLTSGGGIHSRWPLTARAPDTSRGFGATPRATIALPDGGGAMELDAVHPLPPVTDDWIASWQRTLDGVADVSADGRRVVAGDLNATLDHVALRRLLDRGWVDAAESAGAGLRPTFSGALTGEPVPPVQLDHVLVGPDVRVEGVRTRALPGSDHRVLVVELVLP